MNATEQAIPVSLESADPVSQFFLAREYASFLPNGETAIFRYRDYIQSKGPFKKGEF